MAHLRIATGVQKNDRITPYFDPTFAKLIVLGECRVEALDRLSAVLAASQIEGLRHNRAFLAAVVANSDFQTVQVDATWIACEGEALLAAMP